LLKRDESPSVVRALDNALPLFRIPDETLKVAPACHTAASPD
jgi:hypothetical protein